MFLKHRLERLYKFEYWSFWFLYLPFLIQWFYYSLRSLSFVYFTRANYKTPYGAFFQYSKHKITESINAKYLPKSIFYTNPNEVESTLGNEIYNNKFVYKPDLAGPICSTPFIKKICARKDGKIIITAKIIIPFIPGKTRLLV